MQAKPWHDAEELGVATFGFQSYQFYGSQKGEDEKLGSGLSSEVLHKGELRHPVAIVSRLGHVA